jgi:hypothetical protein
MLINSTSCIIHKRWKGRLLETVMRNKQEIDGRVPIKVDRKEKG